MNAQFSEFSYGYALTDNILHGCLAVLPVAPIFPSLISEGSSGGGYDVKIPLYPVPIFLQFKIPQVMRRKSLKMPTGATIPYLRMHLRTNEPNQHKLLLELEADNNVVAYVTPDFWKTSQLDDYYFNKLVPLHTRYFMPSQIGPLNNSQHQITYCTGNPAAWLFSDPQELKGEFDGKSFYERISVAVKEAKKQEPLTFFNELCETIAKITKSQRQKNYYIESTSVTMTTPPSNGFKYSEIAYAARKAAYLAQVHLDCTLIIAGR